MIQSVKPVSYKQLGPEKILAAVESAGYPCDGYMYALNSYENRVYQVGIEDAEPVVVKFYRPDRWSDDAIQEEHLFTLELQEYDLPVIAPLKSGEQTLHFFKDFRFAIFPRRGGRSIELSDPEQLRQLGRFIARMHNVGEINDFQHRPELDIQEYGFNSCQYLLANHFIPAELETAYRSLAEDLIRRIENCYQRAGNIRLLRLHGDCHPGNILFRENELFILDFDDARSGPAIQDLWMYISGDRNYMTARLIELLEGYTEFREFDPRELYIIEALRTLRLLNYSAWIARRWDDPAFPIAFPYFNTQIYWQDQILVLREQAALMDEPPLECNINQ